jgi:hypothetical protein
MYGVATVIYFQTAPRVAVGILDRARIAKIKAMSFMMSSS